MSWTLCYDQRLANARAYFGEIEPNRKLNFYYANYSNPFSEDEAKRYVLIGLSRVKALGEELFYESCSKEVKEKYAGGFIWQRAITSHYPDQGLRLPYHAYRDSPEVLQRIALFPENPRLCKYATRHLNDDDALGLVEGFHRVVLDLLELGDTTEDWAQRARWLETLIAELWQPRGLLPGMPSVLKVFSFEKAIPFFKQRALEGQEIQVRDALFALKEEKIQTIPGLKVEKNELKDIHRRWKLRDKVSQRLLRDVFPRFALRADQISKILNDTREQNGITSSLRAITKNPYILSEQYQGDDPDDIIPWGTIDRGMTPSPELGGDALTKADDGRRFRALLVEVLKREDSHVFIPGDFVIAAVNHRLSHLPEWKRFSFHEQYLDAD